MRSTADAGASRMSHVKKGSADYREKLEKELELLSAEACLNGMDRKEFLTLCDRIFGQMQPA